MNGNFQLQAHFQNILLIWQVVLLDLIIPDASCYIIFPSIISNPPAISPFKSTYCWSKSLLDDFFNVRKPAEEEFVSMSCDTKTKGMLTIKILLTAHLARMPRSTLPPRILLRNIINMLGKIRIRLQQILILHLEMSRQNLPHDWS